MGGGEYVILTDDELALGARALPRVRVIGFVDLDEIDPIYFRSSYFMAPKGEAAEKAYALLRRAMQRREQGGHRQTDHAEQGVPGGHPAG